MKLDWTTVFSVLIALVIFKIADKMFIDNALSSVFSWEAEGYDDFETNPRVYDIKRARQLRRAA